MGKTEAASIVSWHKKIEALQKRLMNEGRFVLLMQGKAMCVFKASHHGFMDKEETVPCPKKHSRITGAAGVKVTKTGIIKVVLVCLVCGQKSQPEIVIRKKDYDRDHPKFKEMHWFMKRYNLKPWHLKK
jgi:hypothetical protein